MPRPISHLLLFAAAFLALWAAALMADALAAWSFGVRAGGLVAIVLATGAAAFAVGRTLGEPDRPVTFALAASLAVVAAEWMLPVPFAAPVPADARGPVTPLFLTVFGALFAGKWLLGALLVGSLVRLGARGQSSPNSPSTRA